LRRPTTPCQWPWQTQADLFCCQCARGALGSLGSGLKALLPHGGSARTCLLLGIGRYRVVITVIQLSHTAHLLWKHGVVLRHEAAAAGSVGNGSKHMYAHVSLHRSLCCCRCCCCCRHCTCPHPTNIISQGAGC
jgi:hypothetical protein